MPPDKPLKLLPESVRTFLEFGLKHVVNEQKATENEEQKKLSMHKFVRMLCISNSSLNCSRRIDFDIYRLNLYFSQYTDMIRISLSFGCYDFSYENSVSLTYDCACKVIKLLSPPYTDAYFGYDTEADLLEQGYELLKLTKGRIGLDLRMCFNGKFAQKVLKTFANYTHKLRCSIELFMFDKSLQFPILSYLYVDSPENFGQIAYVLNHNVKELGFGRISENFAIEDEKFDDLKNKTVMKLNLFFDQLSYAKIEKLVEYLHKSCLNLKNFDMKYEFEDGDEYEDDLSVNQIPDQVVIYVGRMNSLKARFENYLISTFIKFDIQIVAVGERNNTWVETVCKSSELNDWQIKPFEKFYKYDKLEMTFHDAGCKLELSFAVITRDSDYDIITDSDYYASDSYSYDSD